MKNCLPFALLLAASVSTSALAASNVVVKRFGSGAGSNAVGMVDASEDTELAAPQALTAGQGKDLYLLDQVNGRILRFDPKAPTEQTRSLELPSTIQPTDLVISKGDIYVWDGDIHQLQPNGHDDAPVRGLEPVITRGAPDQFALGAFAQMGSQKPGSEADLLNEQTRAVNLNQARPRARQTVYTRGKGAVTADVIPDKKGRQATIEVRTLSPNKPIADLKVEVRDQLGVVEFLEIDRQGRMYVMVENIPGLSNILPSAYVFAYNPDGKASMIFDLPLSESIALSRRFVTINEDGDVYFLRTRQNEVEVVAIGGRPVYRDKVLASARVTMTDAGPDPSTLPLTAVRQLTRQQVIETAFAFEGMRWNVTNSAYGKEPDTACTGFHRIRRPGYLIGKLNQEVRGVPYCWGCHGSLNQIRLNIDRGVLAGNVCTRNAPRNDVVGVDCSAFVSAAWGLANHFTTVAIPTITTRVSNPWDMQPGDAFNKPGSHVMLFLRFTPDRKAEVMEASPGACNGRVCRNVYPLSSLLARGYQPVRFRALADTVVASAAPIAAPAAAEPDASDAPARKHRRKRH